MRISLVKDSDGKITVQPDEKPLKLALTAITCWHGFDELVTKALRRAGYGGDGYGITYPNDLDEHEKANSPIQPGLIGVYDFVSDTDLILQENQYLILLKEVCLLRRLEERATLVEKFTADPTIANNSFPKEESAYWSMVFSGCR